MVVAERPAAVSKRGYGSTLRGSAAIPRSPASGDEGHVRWEICLHILFCPKFRRKFQEKYEEGIFTGLPAQKLSRVAAIGATTSDSKELSHGLAWSVAPVARPSDGGAFS
jgi:hypothetical protein